MNALLLAAAAATTAASDLPQDYTHVIPLTVNGKPSVVQLQLPRDAYLNARSASLNDLRVFDANGAPQPFALRQPDAEPGTTHRALPVRIFPLMAERPDVPLAGLEVSTATDGRVLSVRLPSQQGAASAGRAQERLAGLVLDLRQEGKQDAPMVDALHFTLPAGRNTYTGQVWLEASDDLKHWDAIGVAELSWLANASEQTLANDKLEFPARPMRYARLSWRSGEPLPFASISAQSPERGPATAPIESLLLQPQPGRDPRDLQYVKPAGVTPRRVGLQVDSGNMVLPAMLGSYVEVHRTGQFRFEPALRTTFYRLEKDGKSRLADDITVPSWIGERWVLRFDTPPPVKPPLRVSWVPATLVFVAGGTPPYKLAVGRDKAAPAGRDINEVAPGFSAAELRTLDRATAGAAQEQLEALANAAKRASADNSAAQHRLLILWGVLVLGVAVVAGMVWRLLRQAGASST
ncbi:DUF3999 family protein [Duganella sp. Root1480D1]|uniref:DUF3999 family protein n=1 Tax=Duganella sp. Root1480D1 TaxID=1736471 RepID=UPI00070D3635|nr:DUF3999 family protein [Duganella sp. Root1480D1]KQZ27704.1 hypothetical protein ASD58_14030 [Duganella sp. Root1480D1]